MKMICTKGKKKNILVLTCEEGYEVQFLKEMTGLQGFTIEIVNQYHKTGQCPAIIITKQK